MSADIIPLLELSAKSRRFAAFIPQTRGWHNNVANKLGGTAVITVPSSSLRTDFLFYKEQVDERIFTMLDLKFLRENPEIVKQNIKNKFQDS